MLPPHGQTGARWRALGAALVAVGVCVSRGGLETVLSPDGQIANPLFVGTILLARLAALGLGLLLLLRPPQRRMPWLAGLPALVALGAVAAGGAYATGLHHLWIRPPVRDLAAICDWLKHGNDPYLGLGALEEQRVAVAALSDSDDLAQRVQARMDLAELQLRHGEVPAAIELLEQSLVTARAQEVSDELLADLLLALGVAYIRLGEIDHCVRFHNPASCIFPIQGGGVWANTKPSETAIEHLLACLALQPSEATARWLLNLAHMTAGTWPAGVPDEWCIPLETFDFGDAIPSFREVAGPAGVDAFNLVGGAITDDVDGDGYVDIVTSTFDPCEPLIYYHNTGDGTFEDRSAAAGLTSQLGGFNLNQADYDNDGRLDVLVLRGAWMRIYGRQRNSLLHQEADGTFTDVTRAAGLGEWAWPNLAAAWADYDNDGHVDLYVGNELIADGRAGPSQLFHNLGDGTFEEVAAQAGVENLHHAKAISWSDYDNDGDPDLFVSNLEAPNRLYQNDGQGRFRDVAQELGVARNAPNDRTFAAWFWDVDNDGWDDLFVAGYGAIEVGLVARDYLGLPVPDVERMYLYRNDGQGGFEDVSSGSGLDQVRMPMGANFEDVDNDGRLDIYLGTGAPPYSYLVPNLLYRNQGDFRFADVTLQAGVGHLQKGHAVAFADLDNDGDQDIYAQMGGLFADDPFANALFENPGNDNSWLGVRLEGRISNRSAFGARLCATFVDDGERRSVWRTVGSGGSFGASTLRQHLGLGRATRVEELRVRWPSSGIEQVFRDLEVDRLVDLIEGEDELRVLDLEPLRFSSEE